MKRLICLGGSITAADRLFCSDSLGEGYVSMLPPLLPDFQILNKGIDDSPECGPGLHQSPPGFCHYTGGD